MTPPEKLPAGHLPCPKCHGAGHLPLAKALSQEHVQTLQEITAAGTEGCTIDQLSARGITRNALNNRVNDLERIGLVERIGKRSKWVVWRAVGNA